MKLKPILAMAVLAAITLISCPQEPGNSGDPNDPNNPGLDNQPLYLCAVTNTGAYYVNGTKLGNLAIPAGAQIGQLGCTVSDGKMYVWGRYGSGKHAYWIDGVKQELPDAANIVAISLVTE